MTTYISNSTIRAKDNNGKEHIVYPITKAENVKGLLETIKNNSTTKANYDSEYLTLTVNSDTNNETHTIKGIKDANGNTYTFTGANSIINNIDVDTAFSTTSENPIQNKVITNAINDINSKFETLTSSIPSVAGLATEQFVTNAISTKADKSEIVTDYNDLSNKPNIPSIEGLASEEYVTTALQNKADRNEIPSIEGLATEQSVTDLASRVSTLESGIGDGEIDLSGIQEEISNKADKEHTHSYNDLEDLPIIPNAYDDSVLVERVSTLEASVEDKADKSEIVTDYNFLSNLPTIPSIEGLASTEYVTTQLENKANKGEIITSYNDLQDKPAIPSIEGLATTQSVTDLAQRVTTLESNTPSEGTGIPSNYEQIVSQVQSNTSTIEELTNKVCNKHYISEAEPATMDTNDIWFQIV